MKKLTRDLKRMLSGLALQDAGEYLPMSDKLSLLGIGKVNTKESRDAKMGAAHRTRKATGKRLVLLCGDRMPESVIDYVVNASQLHSTGVDVLTFDKADSDEDIAGDVKRRLRQSGCDVSIIKLQQSELPARAIRDYILCHPSSSYLIAPANDTVANEIVGERTLHYRGCPIPIVLVQEPSVVSPNIHSAA